MAIGTLVLKWSLLGDDLHFQMHLCIVKLHRISINLFRSRIGLKMLCSYVVPKFSVI